LLSLGYNLTRTLWAGALGILSFQIFGNLHGGLQVLQGSGFNWWEPTRLIKDVAKDGHYLNRWWWSASPAALAQAGLGPDAARDGLISEFPAFSFLHGDLHPHFTTLPLAFLVLALGLNLVKNPSAKPLGLDKRQGRLDLLALGLSLAALAMANTWDLPAYGLAASLLLASQQHWLGQFNGMKVLKQWLLPSAALLAGLLVLALPFLIYFKAPAAQGFGLHGAKTGLHDTLLFWGFFLAVLMPFAFLRLSALAQGLGKVKKATAPAAKAFKAVAQRECNSCGAKLRPGKELCGQCGTRNPEPEVIEELPAGSELGSPAWADAFLKVFSAPAKAFQKTSVKVVLPVFALLWFVALFVWPTVAVFLLLLVLGALLLAVRGDSAEALFSAALMALGSLLVLGCEFYYLRDGFAGNPNLTRMNTVFKFYFQAWVLFSVALPFALWWVVQRLQSSAPFALRVAHSTVLGLLALGALVYPLKAVAFVWADYDGQRLTPTLDGSDWFKRQMPSDWGAVEQLRKVSGQPVIAEAVGGAYTHYARVASYTGFKSVQGWANHEGQWRRSWAYDTGDKVDRLYAATTDIAATRDLLAQLGVDYVFVGQLEREKYGAGADKFAQIFPQPFIQSGGTVVYKVR
jgi:uncharacterized membrane protein